MNAINNIIVSIIIPCRNEEKFIGKCIDSIITNGYPLNRIEIIVVDGMSTDNTRKIVDYYAKCHPNLKLLDNLAKIVPCALNIGIKEAAGEIIMRMDAHSEYEKEYISKCVKYLNEKDISNVGGVCVTLPMNDSVVSHAIALSLSHPFGVGNSYFRVGLKEPRYVDTVPFGCYKKNIFDQIGMFNEHLVRNQDIELNLRLKKIGGKILLIPDIISYYHARATLKALAKNNFWNGFWVIYSTRYAEMPFSMRHLIPLLFVLSLLSSLLLMFYHHYFIYLFALTAGLYGVLNMVFSLKLSFKNGLKYLPALLIVFPVLHCSYGFGSIWGGINKYLTTKEK